MLYSAGSSHAHLMLTTPLDCTVFSGAEFNVMLCCSSWSLGVRNPLVVLPVRDYIKGLARKQNEAWWRTTNVETRRWLLLTSQACPISQRPRSWRTRTKWHQRLKALPHWRHWARQPFEKGLYLTRRNSQWPGLKTKRRSTSVSAPSQSQPKQKDGLRCSKQRLDLVKMLNLLLALGRLNNSRNIIHYRMWKWVVSCKCWCEDSWRTWGNSG